MNLTQVYCFKQRIRKDQKTVWLVEHSASTRFQWKWFLPLSARLRKIQCFAESCHTLCRLLRKSCKPQNATGEVGRARLREQEIGKHDVWLENGPLPCRSVLGFTTVLLRGDDCSHYLKKRESSIWHVKGPEPPIHA